MLGWNSSSPQGAKVERARTGDQEGRFGQWGSRGRGGKREVFMSRSESKTVGNGAEVRKVGADDNLVSCHLVDERPEFSRANLRHLVK